MPEQLMYSYKIPNLTLITVVYTNRDECLWFREDEQTGISHHMWHLFSIAGRYHGTFIYLINQKTMIGDACLGRNDILEARYYQL